MELLKTKCTRFYGILQSSVISRFMLDNQIGVTIPGDVRVNEKEIGKSEKYKMLKDEFIRMWGMEKVNVILLVIGALDAIPTGFEKYVATIGIDMKGAHVQKASLLGTAKILRLVVGY